MTRTPADHFPGVEPPTTQATAYDVVVVGARCAGASVATWLARAGRRVAVVDRATFPSDTLSTHVMFPDALALLDDLGALDRLRHGHRLVPSRYAWRVLGHEVAGSFTPVAGHDRCLSVRRVALDAVLVELAREAGAAMLLGRRVVDVVGAGRKDDPVRGVVLDDGRQLTAPIVLAADGRRSTVAARLGLARTGERRGEVGMLIGYWRGLPASDWCRFDMHPNSALMSTPCEDGLHMLVVAGPPEITRGAASEVESRYRTALHSFPAVLNPRLLERAELAFPVARAPETMMRGFFQDAAGPGWALLGDAGHFKHPTTGQGIGDALSQARYVADRLLSDGDLTGYQRWRDERSAEPYEFSFRAARLPEPRTASRFAGLAADPVASQQFLDTFTRRARVAEVFTPARSARWRAAAAYEDGLHRVAELGDDLVPEQWATRVPACPLWTVRDLVSHLAGVAADATEGRFYDGALDAWTDPALAQRREAWTARHVEARRADEPRLVLADFVRAGHRLVAALRRGDSRACDVPGWMVGAPAADLAAHVDDLREALGMAPDPEAPITRYGAASYRGWLRSRIERLGLAPLVLADGTQAWVLGGDGEPGAVLKADPHELWRAISGRRRLDDVGSWEWQGDPTPYLPILSPYPPPA
jgi:uncharacterized protein (TIGR03083 family)